MTDVVSTKKIAKKIKHKTEILVAEPEKVKE